MADLTITAANVAITSDTTTQRFQAGGTITQGQPVYLKSSDQKYYACDVNTGAEEATAVGIAITPASADEYFLVATSGNINPGATVAASEVYVVSESGAISPASDLTTGDYACVVYIGVATDEVKIGILNAGVVRA